MFFQLLFLKQEGKPSDRRFPVFSEAEGLGSLEGGCEPGLLFLMKGKNCTGVYKNRKLATKAIGIM